MEPLNGFQANAAPSEAAGLPAKLLACAGMGRAAKRQSFFELPSLRSVARCAGLGAGCSGKCHVDGVYIILSAKR